MFVGGRELDANALTKAVYYADVALPELTRLLTPSAAPALALPPLTTDGSALDGVRDLERRCGGRVSLIGVGAELGRTELSLVESILRETRSVMVSLRVRSWEEEAREAVRLLRELGPSWADYARLALVLGGDVLTAALPVAATGEDSFAVSVSALDALKFEGDARRELVGVLLGACSSAARSGAAAGERVGLRLAWVDAALVSGAKLTVPQLIEVLSGLPFYSVGAVSELALLSELLKSRLNLRRVRNAGAFVITYPGDPLLNNYASMEAMTLKDFARLAASPVIGLDMLVVPSWASDEVLSAFLRDVCYLSALRGGGTFVRLILADAEPGEAILVEGHDVVVIEPLM